MLISALLFFGHILRHIWNLLGFVCRSWFFCLCLDFFACLSCLWSSCCLLSYSWNLLVFFLLLFLFLVLLFVIVCCLFFLFFWHPPSSIARVCVKFSNKSCTVCCSYNFSAETHIPVSMPC